MNQLQDSNLLRNWASYEYIGPGHTFHPVHYEEQGGVQNSPYIWADDSMWSLDTPEEPTSILALLTYRNWTSKSVQDVRDAVVSFYLRGDEIDLKGAKCYFWVTTSVPYTVRWHYIACPIEIENHSWGKRQEIRLVDDSHLWHRSYSRDAGEADELSHTLRTSTSYGFSFVGFEKKVTGRISLSDFSLHQDDNALWSYSADLHQDSKNWLTVSGSQNKQIPISKGEIQEGLGNGQLREKPMIYATSDRLLILNNPTFAYLAFVHADHSTKNQDLCDAVFCTATCSNNFQPENGSIHFFLEHSESNTRWIYKDVIREPVTEFILNDSSEKWFRITGTAPLMEVLKGKKGTIGYDYLGFMIVNSTQIPTGDWGIYYFSLGPKVKGND